MRLKLERPLAIFDLEATGLDVTNDRIVEIAILKVEVDGSTSEFSRRVNPQIPIPQEVSLIHGIYDADVAAEKNFIELAPEVVEFLGNADLAGYNSNKFDIPLLAEELLRAGLDVNIQSRNLVDVQNIFHKMEQRTLVAAYAFYCQKELVNAHNAMADVQATWEVLKAQVEKYDTLSEDVPSLAQFSKGGNLDLLDFAGRLAINEKGEAVYNFGKHKGRSIAEVNKIEPGYYGWMLDANFPLYTKQVLKLEMEKIKQQQTPSQPKNNTKKEKPVAEGDLQTKLEALKNKFK